MTKYIFIIIGFFLLAPFLVHADSSEVTSSTQIQQGDFSLNQDVDFPHTQPGPSGSIPQIFFQIMDKKEDGFVIDNPECLNNLNLEEMIRLAKGVNNKFNKKINYRIPQNNKPIQFLPGIPSNMHLLGEFDTRGKLDQDTTGLRAMLMAEAKMETFCKYGLFKVKYKSKPTRAGFAPGGGAAKAIGNEAAASVGGVFGYSSAENFTIPVIVFQAYGGVKVPLKKSEKQEPAKQTTKVSVKQEAKKKIEPICESIYFAFDEDIPLPGQEVKFEKIGLRIKNNPDIIDKLISRGSCDERGGEDYNSYLGLRRGKNTMYISINYAARLCGTEKEKKAFVQKIAQKFRATSASNLDPDFKAGNGISKEEAHQLNRRVDIILNGQNLTVPTIGGK